jgi:hypothetical protein
MPAKGVGFWRGVYAEALSRVARSLGCIVPTTR